MRTLGARATVALVSSAVALAGFAACGTSVGVDPAQDGGPTPQPTSTVSPPTTQNGLPCDVDAVLAKNCRSCHSDTPTFGAPMPLTSYESLVAPAKSDASKRVIDLVRARIRDDAAPMPQAPNPRLSAADIATIDAWANAGATRSTATCGGNPDAGPVDPLDCKPDLKVGPASAWAMPQAAKNEYVCYGVDVTADDDKHVVALAPRIENAKIVHHVLIFKSDTAYPTKPQECPSGGSLQWRLMYGWAPGAKNMIMPKEAGFALKKGQSTHFVVQVHYNNAQGLPAETDASGFDLCTSTPRQYEADVLAFGTTRIDVPRKSTADRTCTFNIPNALTDGKKIFAAMPHMHELGTAIETKLYKGGTGAPIDLGTVPTWDFNTQYWQPLNAEIKAGDTVKTRCAWKNTTDQDVGFGENTEDEMCYSFTLYYPRIESNLWSWTVPAATSSCVDTPK